MESQTGEVRSTQTKDADGKGGRLDAVKKWLGLGATILSAGSAIYGTLQYQAEKKEKERQTTALLVTSQTQQNAGDYPEAWVSLQKAVTAIDSEGLLLKLTGGLSAQQARVHTAQQDLAMTWLREARSKLEEGHHYAEIVDPVLGVLSTGAEQSTGARKGDLLAHIGRGYSLKQEDGIDGLHPEKFYRDALAADPTNPYANTYLAIALVLQTSASPAGIAEVKQRFAAALSSPRATGDLRKWVRGRELRALRSWLHYPAPEALWWEAIRDMIKAGEPLEEEAADGLRAEYLERELSVPAFERSLVRLLPFAPVAEHVQILRQLVGTAEGDTRGYFKVCLALALEKAGRPEESLSAWQDARPEAGEFLVKDIEAAIARLSPKRS